MAGLNTDYLAYILQNQPDLLKKMKEKPTFNGDFKYQNSIGKAVENQYKLSDANKFAENTINRQKTNMDAYNQMLRPEDRGDWSALTPGFKQRIANILGDMNKPEEEGYYNDKLEFVKGRNPNIGSYSDQQVNDFLANEELIKQKTAEIVTPKDPGKQDYSANNQRKVGSREVIDGWTYEWDGNQFNPILTDEEKAQIDANKPSAVTPIVDKIANQNAFINTRQPGEYGDRTTKGDRFNQLLAYTVEQLRPSWTKTIPSTPQAEQNLKNKLYDLLYEQGLDTDPQALDWAYEQLNRIRRGER